MKAERFVRAAVRCLLRRAMGIERWQGAASPLPGRVSFLW
jgi:hypothetical protein